MALPLSRKRRSVSLIRVQSLHRAGAPNAHGFHIQPAEKIAPKWGRMSFLRGSVSPFPA